MPDAIIGPPDWETLPRMLWDLCDGHPGTSVELYAFDGWTYRQWYCKGCWIKFWHEYKQKLAEVPDA
jgi:hypothetical protein